MFKVDFELIFDNIDDCSELILCLSYSVPNCLLRRNLFNSRIPLIFGKKHCTTNEIEGKENFGIIFVNYYVTKEDLMKNADKNMVKLFIFI